MNRWIRLIAAVVAMIMIGNQQYAWTLFVNPIIAATGWKLSEVQWGFTFFIAIGTWAMPAAGWLIDRLGPRTFMSIAGLLCGAGWAGMGQAQLTQAPRTTMDTNSQLLSSKPYHFRTMRFPWLARARTEL